jgi:peptide/nickel transport system substrate-binding protein
MFNGYYMNILAKEHVEGSSFKDTIVGTGPYVLADQTPGISATFKRNPDYYGKPLGYFDEIQGYIGGEDAKRLADVVAGNIDIPFWFGVQEREQLKQSRPDMTYEIVQHGGDPVLVRTDQAPFNDVRVRQALSMSIDRAKLSSATAAGEGEWDSQVQIWYTDLGARPVKDIPGAAKYWEYNVAEAKKLLAAAGITTPLSGPFSGNDSSGPTGQALVDKATLITQNWKDTGIGNFQLNQLPGPQVSATINLGKYDGLAYRPGPAFQPSGNTGIYQEFYTPASGDSPPTNQSHYNNPTANGLLDKLISTLDAEARKPIWRSIEELLATEQPQIHTNTFPVAWFYNPKLVNVRMPMIFGSSNWFQKWWLT